MNKFSTISQSRLATCHPDLQLLFNDVIQFRDCAILIGHRCEADQALACAAGKSQTPWPASKHNSEPSQAVDVAPSPVDWSNIDGFKSFAAFVKLRAAVLGISIRWGGDFKTLKDYDHFELEEAQVNGRNTVTATPIPETA